jgi:glycosyltransferase involved in cell wall biosynthesis
LNHRTTHILFVIDGLRPGGKERQLVEILKNIDTTRYSAGVITLNSAQHYSEVARKFSSYYRELKKRPFRSEPFFTIWKCFREFNPDVVHTWDTISSLFVCLPCKYYNIPLINGAVRDSHIEHGFSYHFKRFLLHRADVVVANSDAGLREYKTPGTVIYNVINPARFLASDNRGEFNLLMTANFSCYKDHETFLKAAVELVRDKTVDNVYLPGEGVYKRKYSDRIAAEPDEIRNRFHFPGAVSTIEEYLSSCKIGVLCSTIKYGEGLSNSVLEYMAAGLVAIVTDIGGSSEIIEDGKNGFLIAPGDYLKIIDLVRRVKADPDLQAKIIEQAKNTIATKFSMEKNLERLCDVYNRMVRES